ncbi:MAG: aldo-keto reductase family protein [Anaerolineae bacterium]
MDQFPRTVVGGVSLSRMIVGSNWIRGYSHTSKAKDRLIVQYQTREKLADMLTVFLEAGVDAILWMPTPELAPAIADAEQRTGRKMMQIMNPNFNLLPGGPANDDPEAVFDRCLADGATFCLPHQAVTDALLDRRAGVIRDIDVYTKMIRDRGMIPGLSTHMPETPVYADRQGADVETYIQIYNAAGFLMQVEGDWVMRVIREAQKPVLTIKPLAAGRLLPVVGLGFVWSTIREQDMVCIGCLTADEAREVIDISLDLLERRQPDNELQYTRSKSSLVR